MKKKILTVIGTRPNYIKITQFEKEFAKYPDHFEYRLLHTGQHFDKTMKDIFFQQLQIHKIDYGLEVNHGTPTKQIGEIMMKIDEVLQEWKPDLVIVVGDVNSTLAAAIAANKANIKLAHIESGLRSNDRTMPEEFNRIITDELADFLFVTEKSGSENLLSEGKKHEQIFFVGNTMIDTLIAFDSQFDQSPIMQTLGVNEKDYVLMTMHRPSNVDDAAQLKKVIETMQLIAAQLKIVFPIHPRTKKNIEHFGLNDSFSQIKNLILTEPLDYFSFQKLIKHAAFVVTDSGGIQEETTYRKIPCLTLRENTERPSTVEIGSNELLPFDLNIIKEKVDAIVNGSFKKGNIPPLWDGKATQRIVEVLKEKL
ncbi:MAG: UDP-N-acetylglucosamine 2-epimerase (non-hydrolyzing) [Chitinophagales bacterium]|nr:UDP-N-acetylglucosamine 2-epimerase (non-hydrolyzing) [Chitinophagales bacterium]